MPLQLANTINDMRLFLNSLESQVNEIPTSLGADTQVLYNSEGAVSGSNTFVFVANTGTLQVPTIVTDTSTFANTTVTDTLVANNANLGIITETSARRFKKNIREFYGAITLLDQLEPVKYEWKENGKTDYGFIAEQVNEILPELVRTDSDGNVEGISYSKLTSVLTQGFKEMMDYIDSLNERIKNLENN